MIERDLENAAYAKVVARAWSDPAFKEKLLAEPAAVLAAAGVGVPADLTVKLVENTDNLVHLVLPRPPAEGELSHEALDSIAAGYTGGGPTPVPKPSLPATSWPPPGYPKSGM
jgi:Nitrile hydratase, alpha chain